MRSRYLLPIAMGTVAVLATIIVANLPVSRTQAAPDTPKLSTETAEKITDQDAEQLAARLNYAKTLEQRLYSQGIDAYVQATGKQHDTLQISWEAMSLPIVHSMINSPAMLSEAPSLGFKQVIFTNGGRFSKLFGETWAYSWDGESWTLH